MAYRCGNTPVFAQAEEEVYVVYVAGHDGHGGLLPYAEYCHGSYAFCKVIASGFIRDGQGAMMSCVGERQHASRRTGVVVAGGLTDDVGAGGIHAIRG